MPKAPLSTGSESCADDALAKQRETRLAAIRVSVRPLILRPRSKLVAIINGAQAGFRCSDFPGVCVPTRVIGNAPSSTGAAEAPPRVDEGKEKERQKRKETRKRTRGRER